VPVELLFDTTWVLVGYGDPANPTVVSPGLQVTALFTAEGQVSGFAGCNQFSGEYNAASDGTLSISPLASTMMFCEQGMDVESAYLAALQAAKSFAFPQPTRLEITYTGSTGADQLLVFTEGQSSLTGNTWVLLAYGETAAPTPVPDGTVVTAIFADDGVLSGNSGCNTYAATYTTQDDRMTITPPGSTMMACPSGMQVEAAFLEALPQVQTYTITGRTLSLSYNDGQSALTFTSANLPLENSLWTLAAKDGEMLPEDLEITASFTPGDEPDQGTVSGSAGCNRFNAGYVLEGNNISIDAAATTMMACPPEQMDAEQAYLQAMQAAQTYQVLGRTLLLTTAEGMLTFTADRTPLISALWTLISLGDINDPQAPVQGANFTAQFMRAPGVPSGVLAGTTGCNEYSAAFAASLDEIKINQPLSTTNTSCAPGLVDQEALYFLALNDATTYHISGSTLTIPYDQGRQALVFSGSPLGEAPPRPLSELNNTLWYLYYQNDQPILPGTTINAQITVNADGVSGSLNGAAGCNFYVATFGGGLGMETTLNATQVCSQPAGVMEQEQAYMASLERAYGYWLTGDQLILNTGSGTLTYRTSPPQSSSDQRHLLVNKTWFLVAYNNIYTLPGAQEPFTFFQPNGSVQGYTGCNNLNGSYQTNLNQISFSNLAVTFSACPNSALQAQEQAMLGILGSARTYQIANTVLQIVGDQGVLIYSLTPPNRPEEIQPPQAVIQAPSQAYVGEAVTFDARASTSSVPIVSYQWDFGDGGRGTGPLVQHVYQRPGTYTVQMTVTDQRNVRNSRAQPITILEAGQPTPTAVPPTAEPTKVPTAAPTAGPSPEPTVAPTEAPPTQAPPTQAPPTEPPPTEAPSVPPQAAIRGPQQVFVGDPATFDASASTPGSTPIVSYAWNFGDGTSAEASPSPSATTIFNQTGNFEVTVIVTDGNGQSSSASQNVVVSSRPSVPLEWALDRIQNSPVLPGTGITLKFQGGQLSGFAGCNTYNGGYQATPNPDGSYTVTIQGQLAVTGQMCPPEVMDQEALYLALLQAANSAVMQGNQLTLASSEGTLTYFQAGTAPTPR
jgi:heat shock protein HslJ